MVSRVWCQDSSSGLPQKGWALVQCRYPTAEPVAWKHQDQTAWQCRRQASVAKPCGLRKLSTWYARQRSSVVLFGPLCMEALLSAWKSAVLCGCVASPWKANLLACKSMPDSRPRMVAGVLLHSCTQATQLPQHPPRLTMHPQNTQNAAVNPTNPPAATLLSHHTQRLALASSSSLSCSPVA